VGEFGIGPRGAADEIEISGAPPEPRIPAPTAVRREEEAAELVGRRLADDGQHASEGAAGMGPELNDVAGAEVFGAGVDVFASE